MVSSPKRSSNWLMQAVELSDSDAEKFKTFLKHYDFISELISSGYPWTGRAGHTVFLDLDPKGSLKSVRFETVNYVIHLREDQKPAILAE